MNDIANLYNSNIGRLQRFMNLHGIERRTRGQSISMAYRRSGRRKRRRGPRSLISRKQLSKGWVSRVRRTRGIWLTCPICDTHFRYTRRLDNKPHCCSRKCRDERARRLLTKLPEPEVIRDLYWNKELSSGQIATLFHVSSQSVVLNFMRTHRIPRRSILVANRKRRSDEARSKAQ